MRSNLTLGIQKGIERLIIKINSKKEDTEMHCTELNKFTLKNLIIKIIYILCNTEIKMSE